ncbi:hypothetical protein HC928_02490 [bacterium]|nr:hypothetical protein [bacterium]
MNIKEEIKENIILAVLGGIHLSIFLWMVTALFIYPVLCMKKTKELPSSPQQEEANHSF